jgi:hypothetical protein
LRPNFAAGANLTLGRFAFAFAVPLFFCLLAMVRTAGTRFGCLFDCFAMIDLHASRRNCRPFAFFSGSEAGELQGGHSQSEQLLLSRTCYNAR